MLQNSRIYVWNAAHGVFEPEKGGGWLLPTPAHLESYRKYSQRIVWENGFKTFSVRLLQTITRNFTAKNKHFRFFKDSKMFTIRFSILYTAARSCTTYSTRLIFAKLRRRRYIPRVFYEKIEGEKNVNLLILLVFHYYNLIINIIIHKLILWKCSVFSHWPSKTTKWLLVRVLLRKKNPFYF